MTPTLTLRGTTWDHERGFGPLAATAKSYGSIRPDVRVEWTARSLQQFADYPVDALAERYDLVVLDHPAIGYAVERGCLVPLDEHLDAAFLDDQRANSVGKSHDSYAYAGHQWALAVDAAAQVASYRVDLFEALGLEVPRTWDDVVKTAELVRRDGRAFVAVPLIPVDALMAFFSLCVGAGEEPLSGDVVVGRPVGLDTLVRMSRLAAASHPASLEWNPPAMLERMSSSDEILYCPLAFGYSNYSRPGFRPRLVLFSGAPEGDGGGSGSTLGGAGLAVSAASPRRQHACDYAAYVATEEVQRTVYFDGGGQPGHRGAWTDQRVNQAASNFFSDTLDSLDRAYLRPRYDGYLDFQDRAGRLLHGFLGRRGDPDALLDELDRLYRTTRP